MKPRLLDIILASVAVLLLICLMAYVFLGADACNGALKQVSRFFPYLHDEVKGSNHRETWD